MDTMMPAAKVGSDEAGNCRAEAPSILKPLCDPVQEGIRHGCSDNRTGVGDQERHVAGQHPDIDERVRSAELAEHKAAASHDGDPEQPKLSDMHVHQEQQEAHERGGEEEDAADIDPRQRRGGSVQGGLLGERYRAKDQTGDGQRNIDSEGGAPAPGPDE